MEPRVQVTIQEGHMANPIERVVGDDWTWFEDYVFASAEWTINCPEGRTCQVGMGVMFRGEPRGEKLRFSGFREFTTIGVGAIHARVVDGKGPCPVRLDHGRVGLIPIISTTIP
jgi:hypothetical protein